MINTVHVGIGPIGQKIVKYAVEHGCFHITGAVDPDPDKAGKELSELCGTKPLGINVKSNLDEAIRGKKPEVVIVTTVSSIASFESQIIELAKAKLHIVSTCVVHQVGSGFIRDKEVIRLNFKATVGEPESYEQVHIDGEPVIQSRIAGGVNGDIATCAITLNAVRSVLTASPGLKTMSDIPPVAFFAEGAV